MTVNGVTVAIITYRREEGLRRLLASIVLHRAPAELPDILIIDNDPAGSARSVADEFGGAVRYGNEPSPGIVSARNAALRIISDSAEWVAFVDDDEWVSEGWLEALVRVAVEEQADVVWGPVLSVFPQQAPSWLVRGGFVQRGFYDDRSVLKTAATNNVLIRLESVRKLPEPFFDSDFSETGGSDAELFWRLSKSGALMVWAQDAVVWEEVPRDRARFRWVWRRMMRGGNVSARLLLRERSRMVVFSVSVARLVGGIGLTVFDVLRLRGLRARGVDHIGKSVGMLRTVVLGSNVREYRRDS